MVRMMKPKRSEMRMASTIEKQTAKLPSDTFLWAAFASIVASLLLRTIRRRETSSFVGQWAPVFLLLGLYRRIAGNDRHD